MPTLEAIESTLHLPLGALGEEEQLLQDSVRRFARKEIAPLVREMDEPQKLNLDLIKKLVDQGLMGIETPPDVRAAHPSSAPSSPSKRSRRRSSR